MIRDELPRGTIGFGVSQANLPRQGEENAADPTAGIFEKALEDRPGLKFLTSAVAAIAGATFASSIAKGPGRDFMRRMSMRAAKDANAGFDNSFANRFHRTYRDVQRVFDEYSDVNTRIRNEGTIELNGGKKISFDDPTQDTLISDRTGFYVTQEEIRRARDLGTETAATWTLKDEMQQQLVKSARRMPYELPAAYVTQRMFTDPLLGTGPDEEVNWSNPIDVVGDFAQQTAKNLALSFIPFEAASGAVKHGYRRAMVDVSELGLESSGRSAVQDVTLGLSLGLNKVGHNASDLINKATQMSRQSMGGMAQAINQAAMRERSVVEYYHMARKRGGLGGGVDRAQMDSGGLANSARKTFEKIRAKLTNYGDQKYADELTAADATKFGRIASSLRGLSGGDPARMVQRGLNEAMETPIDAFSRGTFYQNNASMEYRRILVDQLQTASGVTRSQSQEFVDSFRFTIPSSPGVHISDRIIKEKGARILPGQNTFQKALRDEIAPKFGSKQSQVLADSIESAIKAADNQFTANMGNLKQNLYSSWKDLYRGDIAEQAMSMLGKRKLAYSDFGPNLTNANREFLIRRSAQRAGVATKNARGKIRSTSELAGVLKERGFDPTDTYQMRGFLVGKGDISKPWSPNATNIFGIRAMSVNEALQRNLIDDSSPDGREMLKLARAVSATDYDRTILDQIKIGGMYTTPNRGILNINPIAKSLKTFGNAVANETKIPLIQLQPFKMFGQSMRQSISDKPLIRVLDPKLSARTVPGVEGDQSLLWFNSGMSKGSVMALSSTGTSGSLQSRLISGKYRPGQNNADTFFGRAYRMAIGNMGNAPEGGRTPFQRIFNVDPRQPNSVKEVWRRFRNRKDDPANVSSFARMVLDGELPAASDDVVRGFDNLNSYVRQFGLGPNFIRKARQDSQISKLLNVNGKNIYDMDAHEIIDSMKRELADEASIAKMPELQQKTIRKARRNLLVNWDSKITDPDQLNRALPKNKTQFGLNQRIDEARLDYARYLAIKANPTATPKQFGEFTERLMDEAEYLFNRGQISSRELAESRIGIGSFYTSFAKIRTYDKAIGSQANALNATRDLMDSIPPASVEGGMRGMMKDVEEYRNLGKIRSTLKRKYGVSDYEFSGFEYAPGGEGEVLVKTFGTAFRENPLGATLSAFGFTTWNNKPGNLLGRIFSTADDMAGRIGVDTNLAGVARGLENTLDGPSNLSTGSMFTASLVDRMNKAVGIAGLSVDPSAYSSPVSMYAKGLIGQRVLPIFAAGATALTLDRELGGALNPRDEEGEKVYSPFFLGKAARIGVEAQALGAGIIPGGMTASEKREQILYEDVAIRSGRFWPIGQCVTPEQSIVTDRGVVRAKDIELEDIVLTHDGKQQRVLKIFEREMDKEEWTPSVELHCLPKVVPFESITTDNHPYLAVKKKYCPSSSYKDCRPDRQGTTCNKLSYKVCSKQDVWSPEWTLARDLEVGDYLAYPRRKINDSLSEIDDIPVNRDLGYFVGLYLAEGNVHSWHKETPYAIELSASTKEPLIHEKITTIVKKVFGVKRTTQYREGTNGCKLRFSSVDLAKLVFKWFYDNNRENDKFFYYDPFEMGEEFVLGLLEGLLDGDGHVRERRVNLTTARVSHLLLVRDLLFSLGIPVSIYEHNTYIALNGNPPKQYYAWRLSITGSSAEDLMSIISLLYDDSFQFGVDAKVNKYIVIDNDYVYIKIKNIFDSGYRGKVYDFQVENSYSFCSASTILHNTPFAGGKIEYFRPSWYQRLQSGYQYTDDTFGSPLERLAFGYDFSPLRPLNPYHYENKNQDLRPYPVSGEYFTGPYGPLTPFLNSTLGGLLKPQKRYREAEVEAALASYGPVGQSGIAPIGNSFGSSGNQVLPIASDLSGAAGIPAYTSGSNLAPAAIQRVNDDLVAAASSVFTGNASYPYPVEYRTPYDIVNPRTPNGLVSNAPLQIQGGLGDQASEFAYRSQEFAGIYGFAFGAVRENLGLGSAEFESSRPVLASAGQAYGVGRQFWDLNLGGLGDFPTPLEGEYANLELSEIVRRFIPNQRRQNLINPLTNSLGEQQPWLPGSDYFIDFTRGDPFAKIKEGEMRLPGRGYERFNNPMIEDSGQYSLIDQFKILSDVAPYSSEYTRVAKQVQAMAQNDPVTADIYDEYSYRAEAVQRKREFSPYEDRYESPFSIGALGERIAHADTILNTKFSPKRTAVEDWERFNVYGTPFPQWTNPIDDYIDPALQKATDRNPVSAAAGLGILFGAFGASKRARVVGGMLGAATGATLGASGALREAITGERYLPGEYKEGVAIEEQVDIMKYMRAQRGFNIASAAGNQAVANMFRRQIKQTMYGADIYGSSQEELAAALPKRKREHFLSMVNAPEQERERILSTAGRLERRLYQSAWGMKVERRPDLENYFENTELPPQGSEIYDPRTNMESVQIKMLQNQGIAPSEMGFFPQQVDEANIMNPAYPAFGLTSDSSQRAQLLQLLGRYGISGGVDVYPTPFESDRVDVFSGI